MSSEKIFKPRPRIEAFSDLIFGLALSIGALTIIGQELTSFNRLLTSLGLYSLSFLILVSVWIYYSAITSILPAETETLLSVNILLLFLVSIEPFLFNQLFAQNGAMFNEVSVVYSIDLAVMFIILAFFNHSLLDEKKNHIPRDQYGSHRFARNYALLIALIFLFSTLPFFSMAYIMPLRVYIWIAALILGWIRRIRAQASIHHHNLRLD
jgi:uncharacterized membrane protein